MHTGVSRYYQILDVELNASDAEIKRAYRRKAVLLHPDRNKNSNAHEEFILLTEAYEFLTNHGSGRSTFNFEDWQATERQKARDRAAVNARMQYEAYIQSDYYKKSNALVVFLTHAFFLFTVSLLFAPFAGYILFGGPGIVGGLLLLLVTSSGWVNNLFLNRPQLNFKALLESIMLMFNTTSFLFLIITISNIILFVIATVNTLIPTWILTLLFVSAGYLSRRYAADLGQRNKLVTSKVVSWGIAPLVVNIFFLLNFTFSSGAHTETYAFTHDRRSDSPMIELEGSNYSRVLFAQMFWNLESIEVAKKINYTVEYGIFGLKVVKGYEFNLSKRRHAT